MGKGPLPRTGVGAKVTDKPDAIGIARQIAERGNALRLSLLEARVALLQDLLQQYIADPANGPEILQLLQGLTWTSEADGGGGDVPKRPTPAVPKRRAKKPGG